MAAAGHVAAAGFALLAVAALAVLIGFQASSGSLAALEQKRVDWAKQREQFEHDAKQDKRDGHDAGVLVHAMLSRKGHESLGVAERHLDAATMDVRPGANKRTLDSLSGSLRSYADVRGPRQPACGSPCRAVTHTPSMTFALFVHGPPPAVAAPLAVLCAAP